MWGKRLLARTWCHKLGDNSVLTNRVYLKRISFSAEGFDDNDDDNRCQTLMMMMMMISIAFPAEGVDDLCVAADGVIP